MDLSSGFMWLSLRFLVRASGQWHHFWWDWGQGVGVWEIAARDISAVELMVLLPVSQMVPGAGDGAYF